MKKIGIIGAMEEEITLIKNSMSVEKTFNKAGLCYYFGNCADKEIVLVKSGIGKVNAAMCSQILIDEFKVDAVINVGIAGGLLKGIKIGDIIISSDCVQHDMDTSALGDPVGIIPRLKESYFKADEVLIDAAKKAGEDALNGESRIVLGRVASGDTFVADESLKKRIIDLVGADCAEMEGAAIAQVCYLNEVPFIIIRAISDTAGEDASISFEDFINIAADKSAKLVHRMLEII